DAGDPAASYATPNMPAFDERGFPYRRIAGGGVDIGAFEMQPTPAFADFDHNFNVDGADFLAWQRGFGLSASAVKADGDADNDHDVDSDALAMWADQYGEPAPPVAAAASTLAAGQRPVQSSRRQVVADAVFTLGDFGDLPV